MPGVQPRPSVRRRRGRRLCPTIAYFANAVAEMHHHREQQIAIIVSGELTFTVGGKPDPVGTVSRRVGLGVESLSLRAGA
jgi:hypothetical protein